MPETRSQRPKMNHNEELTDSGRPTKKAKIDIEDQDPAHTFDDDDEEATPQPTEEVRASDLYLDTVSVS